MVLAPLGLVTLVLAWVCAGWFEWMWCQRCGHRDSPFARIHDFNTVGSRTEFGRCGSTHKRKLYPRKIYVFLIEKYIEDLRQDEKHVLDLLEAIMRPTDLVKQELRQILFKMTQIRSKIQNFRDSIFWIPEIRSFPARGQCQPARQ